MAELIERASYLLQPIIVHQVPHESAKYQLLNTAEIAVTVPSHRGTSAVLAIGHTHVAAVLAGKANALLRTSGNAVGLPQRSRAIFAHSDGTCPIRYIHIKNYLLQLLTPVDEYIYIYIYNEFKD